MSIDKTLYNEKSIESLSPLEFTRLRPGVYAGDTTYATQLAVEIFSNAVDEYRLGHGNKIEVSIKGPMVRIRDYGQGFIPNSFRDDGKTILEAAFSVLNTSGKYREDGTYEGTSLGSFGIGSKLATYLSNWLDVITHRDGQMEACHFKEGVFQSREVGKSNLPTGTIVEWQPSKEFFTYNEVEVNELKNLFKTVAALCPGLTIVFDNNGETITYFSKNGITDLVDEAVKGKELIKNRFNMKFQQEKNKLDMVMTYTSNYSENLSGDDIQEGLYIIFNITAPNVAYDAQVKTRITKLEMSPFTTAISEELRQWLSENEKEVKAIADKAINARKARLAAQKAKDAIRQPKEKKKNFLNLPTKLVDCWSDKRSECELLITEGDSAAGGLVAARDSKTQAVFPIRGKILNLYKSTDAKAFANAEVVNIIKALGLELDTKTRKLIYNPGKLRYGKVILCADADSDGDSIKNLLLTYFWSLCPELILNGYIYCAEPPLFRITTNKNKYIYLKDASALEEYKLTHPGEKYLVGRLKGLGEEDPDELSVSLLQPETRVIKQVVVDDVKEADKLFDILMGTSVPPRRAFLLAHSEEANEI